MVVVASPKKVNRSKVQEFPVLSLKERDRRWNATRKMMLDQKVECLLVAGEAVVAGTGADNFFTNDGFAIGGATVIFPIEGELVALMGGPDGLMSAFAGNWLQNEERGEVSWVRDWRFGLQSIPGIVEVLKEKGFANSGVGTIGVSMGPYFNRKGNPAVGNSLKDALPGITLVELWEEFLPIRLTHSEEEIACYRKAAFLVELGSEAALEITRPGVNEREIFSRIIYEIQRHGGSTHLMNLHSGKDNVSWGPPKWLTRTQKPRTIEDGDIVNLELIADYGPMHAQTQVCIAVGKVAEINYKIARTAREAYEIGVKTIRPGVKFSEVCDAMNKPNLREGYWHLTPNVHSMNPLELVSAVTEGIENFTDLLTRFGAKYFRGGRPMDHGEVVLQAGMTFQLEPNSSLGRTRVNIGGNVLVTKEGCEELNIAPCEMRVVG